MIFGNSMKINSNLKKRQFSYGWPDCHASRKNNGLLKPKVLPTMMRAALLTGIHFNVEAAILNVTECEDDGTGTGAGTLSKAILDANELPGSDTILLRTNVTLTGVMKRLIDSNLTIKSDSTLRTINGNNQYRPLFIKSGLVKIERLNVINGFTKGGDSGSGGAGAGMGGGLFIYSGNVEINGVTFSNSSAMGGNRVLSGGSGGGGMFGQPTDAGGGLFADASGDSGGYGGFGRYQNNYQTFGKGANYEYGNSLGHHGGFGGGGSLGYYYYSSAWGGQGGFGGGGGAGDTSGYKGDGAFGGSGGFGAGGGRGYIYYSSGAHGRDGYGAAEGFGSGMGGAIFIRSGKLIVKNSQFNENTATANDNAKGLGGGVFILHGTVNEGSQQGMPYSIPEVSMCGIQFGSNYASGDAGTSLNNDNFFAVGGNLSGFDGGSIDQQCPFVDLISELGFEGELNEINRVESSPFIGPAVCEGQTIVERGCTVIPYDTSQNKAYPDNNNVSFAVANSTRIINPPFHFASHLNDGFYGNGSGWVSNLEFGAVNNWVKIDLGAAQPIELIKFGRDRNPNGFVGRPVGQFRILVAQVDDVYADGNDQNDENEYELVFNSLELGFNGNINSYGTIQANFSPVLARYIKVVFENAWVIIDEIEVQ